MRDDSVCSYVPGQAWPSGELRRDPFQPAAAPTCIGQPITDPAVIEATFAADFEAEGAPGREEVR